MCVSYSSSLLLLLLTLNRSPGLTFWLVLKQRIRRQDSRREMSQWALKLLKDHKTLNDWQQNRPIDPQASPSLTCRLGPPPCPVERWWEESTWRWGSVLTEPLWPWRYSVLWLPVARDHKNRQRRFTGSHEGVVLISMFYGFDYRTESTGSEGLNSDWFG